MDDRNSEEAMDEIEDDISPGIHYSKDYTVSAGGPTINISIDENGLLILEKAGRKNKILMIDLTKEDEKFIISGDFDIKEEDDDLSKFYERPSQYEKLWTKEEHERLLELFFIDQLSVSKIAYGWGRTETAIRLEIQYLKSRQAKEIRYECEINNMIARVVPDGYHGPSIRYNGKNYSIPLNLNITHITDAMIMNVIISEMGAQHCFIIDKI